MSLCYCPQLYNNCFNFIDSISKFFYLSNFFCSTNNDTIKLLSKKEPIYLQKIVFIKSDISVYIDSNVINKIKNNEENIFGSEKINELIKKKILYKKNLHISPAGLYGFYDFAICKYIKQNYILTDYIFSGVSAGAWNSLIMTYKHTNNYNNLLELVFEKIKTNKIKSIKKIQLELKNILLTNSKTEDYELDKLFIVVCVIENKWINNYIYTDFDTLENAIDCCIASSNIPFVTGDMFYKFQDKISYDGGILRNKKIIIKNPNLIISNDMFGKKRKITSLFDSKKCIIDLYQEGISDCKNNIELFNKNL